MAGRAIPGLTTTKRQSGNAGHGEPPSLRVDSAQEAKRLCDEGYAHLEAGRFEEAHALLARARELAPRDPLIHYRLGLLFSDTGRPLEALQALDTAVALQPDNARAHNNRGSALQTLGRLTDAEHAFRRALELAPDLELPYANLGKVLEQQERVSEAVEVYERALARGIDAAVLGHYLAAASGRNTARAPDRWVQSTFDNFAPTFDAHLRSLGYDAPARLAALLRSHGVEMAEILDLGCGTGQCGIALAELKRYLVGVDLSEKMLAQAHERGIYDELHNAEIVAWLRRTTSSFDVVIAADVFIYIGELDEVFREIANVLKSGGWFAFSTEECDLPDYALLPTGRYAQSQDYIMRSARAAFVVKEAKSAVIRLESSKPIPGRLYLLQRL